MIYLEEITGEDFAECLCKMDTFLRKKSKNGHDVVNIESDIVSIPRPLSPGSFVGVSDRKRRLKVWYR